MTPGTISILQMVTYGISFISGTIAITSWLFRRDPRLDKMQPNPADKVVRRVQRESAVRNSDRDRNMKRRAAKPIIRSADTTTPVPAEETTTEYIIRLLKDEPEAWSETSQLAQDGDLGRRIHAKHMYKNQRRGIELELIVFRKNDTTNNGFWQVLYKIIIRKPMVNSLNQDLSEEIHNALEEWTDMMIRRKSQA